MHTASAGGVSAVRGQFGALVCTDGRGGVWGMSGEGERGAGIAQLLSWTVRSENGVEYSLELPSRRVAAECKK